MSEKLKSLKKKKSARDKRMSNFRKNLFKAFDENMFIKDRERSTEQARKIKTVELKELNIGIVGGGMAGMYSSMLLTQLGINHKIFEANGERVGGRVFTKYFDKKPHQYAEMGAMRFPHDQLQSRLFNFWGYLNETAQGVKNAREIPKIPYILYDNGNENPAAGNLLCFNGRKPITRNEADEDNTLLGFDQFFKDPEYDYFKDEDGNIKPASVILDDAIEPFMHILEDKSIYKAWEEIMKYSTFSARGYLQQFGDGKRPYPVAIVNYLETVLTYTGVYDLAFIELILDSYSFDSTEKWSAMDGGTSRIAAEMHNRIPSDKYHADAKVVKLKQEKNSAKISYVEGKSTNVITEEFDRVIITLPFSKLRFIEPPTSWSAAKNEAIRSLKMTNAVKVALGFKSRFWEKEGKYSTGMKGGQSNTDLPSRSVVYPSFGIGEPGPAYILSSYSWQNDADKFTHLTQEEMVEMTLRDVVHLHGEIAREEYLGSSEAVVWNANRHAGGGFEFFASSQFGEMFLDAREPEGSFNFAGEHLDMVHYWIAGSYNSAFRTVWEILILNGLDSKKNLKTLFSALGGGDILPTMIPRFSDHTIMTANALAAEM